MASEVILSMTYPTEYQYFIYTSLVVKAGCMLWDYKLWNNKYVKTSKGSLLIFYMVFYEVETVWTLKSEMADW